MQEAQIYQPPIAGEKIWLSSPHMGGQELKYIREAFDQNWIAPLGPNVDIFEKDLEEFLECAPHVAVLSSGTAALHLALVQCGVSAGDKVICQSMTFAASANPIVYLGATPIFIDSETETWNMDPILLEEAIRDRISKGRKPRAIIAVHLYGMPFQVDRIVSVAEKYEIPLIEDAAEALGSTYKGKACGTFGRFGVLSFNGNKIITTSGGGALVCHSKSDKSQTIFLSTQARDNAPHYQHSAIGYNYRMSNVCAGIGRGQMEVIYERIRARRAMNHFYREVFSDAEGISFLTEPSGQYFSNYWLSTILVNPSLSKFNAEELRLALGENNIESRPLWKPLHMQPVFKNAPFYGGTVSEELFNHGLCLPSGSNLKHEDRERIRQIIHQLL